MAQPSEHGGFLLPDERIPRYERDCPECRGSGRVGATVDAWYGEPRRDEHPCGECDGHGMVLTDEGHDLLRFLDRYFERRRRS